MKNNLIKVSSFHVYLLISWLFPWSSIVDYFLVLQCVLPQGYYNQDLKMSSHAQGNYCAIVYTEQKIEIQQEKYLFIETKEEKKERKTNE